MKNKKNDYRNTLTHAEIYHYALSYLGNKCDEGIKMIKQSDDETMKKYAREMYSPWFFKAKKLCELYTMETGCDYDGLAATFGIELSDLDIN